MPKDTLSETSPRISSFGKAPPLKSIGHQTAQGFTLNSLQKAQSIGDGDETPEPIEERLPEEEGERSRSNEAHLRQYSLDRHDSIVSPPRSIYSPQRTLFEIPMNDSISKMRTAREASRHHQKLDLTHKQSKQATQAFFSAYDTLSAEQKNMVLVGLKTLLRKQAKSLLMSPGKRSMIENNISVQDMSHM